MADKYLRSTDGADADNGTTWALANATAVGAMTDLAAGERLFVSQVHNETTAGAITITLPGTLASPNQILCGNDAAEPPTALATTAIIKTTSGASGRYIDIRNSGYFYGITFAPAYGSVADSAYIQLSVFQNQAQKYDNCTFTLPAWSSTNNYIVINSTSSYAAYTEFNNCTFNMGGAAAFFYVTGICRINGGSIAAGATTIFQGRSDASRSCDVVICGLDLSAYGSGKNIINVGNFSGGTFVFDRCKLGSGVTLITSSFSTPFAKVKFHNCDSADTNYRLYEASYAGTVQSETVVVRTGTLSTAKDNTADVPLSYSFSTTANAEYPLLDLDCDVAYFNETTSAQTATFHVLSFTSTALTDADIGINVGYMQTSGTPLATVASSFKTDVLASSASLTTDTGEAWDSKATAYSAATNYVVGDIVKPSTPTGAIYRCETDAGTTAAEPTWGTTDGGTTSDAAGRTWRMCRRQKIAVSFTAAEQGPVTFKVRQYIPSTTVYVDPVPVIS